MSKIFYAMFDKPQLGIPGYLFEAVEIKDDHSMKLYIFSSMRRLKEFLKGNDLQTIKYDHLRAIWDSGKRGSNNKGCFCSHDTDVLIAKAIDEPKEYFDIEKLIKQEKFNIIIG